MSDVLKATHIGKVSIGEKDLSCAVLEDGTRVLTAKALYDAYGRSRRGKDKDKEGRALLPRFVESKALKPYIDAVLDGGQQIQTIQYKSIIGGNVYEGYRAEILPLLCDAILEADKNKVIIDQQKDLVDTSIVLLRSLSKVGIVALIDEATGYQQDREIDALQKILSMYISEELLPFVKTFPDEFYIQMFRLNGWDYKGKLKTPYAGKLTNYLVYDQLPDVVVDELKRLNPIVKDKGYRQHRHYQRLTKEYGYRLLQTQIATVTAMMRGFDTWVEFNKSFKKSFGINDDIEIESQIEQEQEKELTTIE